MIRPNLSITRLCVRTVQLVAAVALFACTDSITDSTAPTPFVPVPSSVTELQPVVVEGCQYGGEYPNCNSKPSDTSGGAYDDPYAGLGGGGGAGASPEYGEADASACWPTTDPGCKLKKPEVRESTAFRNTLNAIKGMGWNCAAVAARGERALNEGKVFMFDGPRSNPLGEPSVGDSHISQGQVHVSRMGFDGSVNTDAQIAQIFRHEVKHLLGWTHAQMQQPGYECDP